jgi:hypothetical protein
VHPAKGLQGIEVSERKRQQRRLFVYRPFWCGRVASARSFFLTEIEVSPDLALLSTEKETAIFRIVQDCFQTSIAIPVAKPLRFGCLTMARESLSLLKTGIREDVSYPEGLHNQPQPSTPPVGAVRATWKMRGQTDCRKKRIISSGRDGLAGSAPSQQGVPSLPCESPTG